MLFSRSGPHWPIFFFLFFTSLSIFGQQKKPAGFQGNRFHFTADYNMSLHLEGAPFSQLEKLEQDEFVVSDNARLKFFFIGQFSASLDFMLNRKIALFTEYGQGQFFYANELQRLGDGQSFPNYNIPIQTVTQSASGNPSENAYYWGDIVAYNSMSFGFRFFNELGPVSWSADLGYMPVFLSPESNLFYSKNVTHFIRGGLKTTKVIVNNVTVSIGGTFAVSTDQFSSVAPKKGSPFSDLNSGREDVYGFAHSRIQSLMLFRFKVGVGYLF